MITMNAMFVLGTDGPIVADAALAELITALKIIVIVSGPVLISSTVKESVVINMLAG
ncbi:hypothetical protein M3221_01755 [Domibacillus indicus]|uniref:hypothetical protein n=1 Tax=Domibacillus indicus TaxID=1437523 RepID=UPI00203BFBC6|nr:hypothetical protein [Domibacillus indicus]MCM3787138.1 hypothetical protein [Domibacillus indicus]